MILKWKYEDLMENPIIIYYDYRYAWLIQGHMQNIVDIKIINTNLSHVLIEIYRKIKDRCTDVSF